MTVSYRNVFARTFLPAALLCCWLAGCVTDEQGSYVIRFKHPPVRSVAESPEAPDDPALDPVPREVAAALPQKLALLKTGMTRGEVLQSLSLTGYAEKILSHAGGSGTRSWEHLRLRRGHTLVLTFDATRQPPGWVEGEYFGRGVTRLAR